MLATAEVAFSVKTKLTPDMDFTFTVKLVGKPVPETTCPVYILLFDVLNVTLGELAKVVATCVVVDFCKPVFVPFKTFGALKGKYLATLILSSLL